MYNLPHKHEDAIDFLVPYDGYLFQVTVTERHGINRQGIEVFTQKNIFADFYSRKPMKDVRFVFVVEAAVYYRFRKRHF